MATVITITEIPGFKVSKDPYKVNHVLGSIAKNDGMCCTRTNKDRCPCRDYLNRGIYRCGLYVPVMQCGARASV